MAATQAKHRRRKKKRSILPVLIPLIILGAFIIGLLVLYFVGKSKYDGRFLPNTYINDIDVSGLTLTEATEKLRRPEETGMFTIVRRNGEEVNIPISSAGYTYNTEEKVKEIFEKQSHGAWFMGYAGRADYSFTDTATFDKEKLIAALRAADWGSTKTKDAEIVKNEDNTFKVVEAVYGDDMDYKTLEDYLVAKFEQGQYYVKAADSGCYTEPAVVGSELEQKCQKLNDTFTQKIVYDFDYTTETLAGDALSDLISFDEDKLVVTVDEKKCRDYVENVLAKKYDTYDKPRKFHATLQGDIIVDRSDDAVYGWWIDKDKTTKELINMIKSGESHEGVKPVYYEQYGFTYTGVPEARSATDDIGTTYCEIDLSAQHFWYYVKGKKTYECDIVSGQTTSLARTTLCGVYKLWDKQTNYRMKASNSDGDSWDTTCDYWNNVSICGIGMHDSAWRYAFGGTIYQWNGSHGCINMPWAAAKYVYENVPIGTPVVMYYSTKK